MDNAWIIAFYKETDPVKRLELLKANTGDGESEKDKYRKQLWIARYGKRTPVKDEFMRCLMEMKYLAEGTTVDLGGKRRKQGAKIAATLGLSESLLQEKVYMEELEILKEEDRKTGKELYETLYWYLRMKRNVAQTAARLRIHRNTLLPRIARINELLDMDEKDGMECEGILLAMEIEKLKND